MIDPSLSPQQPDISEAASGLEAYFVRSLFAQLRSTSEDPLSGGIAGGVFREMLDEKLADNISEAGGFGIASVIEAQLSQGLPTQSAPAAPPMPIANGAQVQRSYQSQGNGVLTHLPVVAYKSSGFGNRISPIDGILRFHKGLDMAAKTGTPVWAAGSGKVIYAGPSGGYGNLVTIDHGGGLVTRYAHMSEIHVKVGQQVEAGFQVGNVGTTGRSTGPHLHFEVRRDGVAVSPEEELPALKDPK